VVHFRARRDLAVQGRTTQTLAACSIAGIVLYLAGLVAP
jgi:hypothetical protein